jgi:glutaminyl-peptide cyclotransferase
VIGRAAPRVQRVQGASGRPRVGRPARPHGRVLAYLAAALVWLMGMGCRGEEHASLPSGTVLCDYQVVNVYPHDPDAFTEGLIYRDGFLYESTGLNGRSTLRRVQVETGEVVQSRSLDVQYFAEGLTDWDGRLLQLTWESNTGFIYDCGTFELLGTFQYTGEGWGLTHDSEKLIMSDGTAVLRFLDPSDFHETGSLTVLDGGRPVARLNELEFARNVILANVWYSDRIARIDPQSGVVVDWIDLHGLRAYFGPLDPSAVLNGIAYDGAGDRFFVTGKLWPKLFEIRLVPRRPVRP